MMVKEQTIDFIKSLPDDSRIEDIQYFLYVREKLENGLLAIESGKTVPQEKVEAMVAQWGKSSGQNRH